MTPKEHFCHSRLVVPAQTSKAREGTHHLLGCQVSQGGVNRSAIAPPKQHGVFQAFWRSHFPDFTTLHQGIVRSKPPQGTASVLWSFHVCFMSLKHPRPLLGTPQNSAPPKKNTRWGTAGFSWGLPPLLPPHWKPKALAPLDCSPQRRRSMKMNQMAKMAGRHCEIIWNQQIFQLDSKKRFAENFVSKSQISSMFGFHSNLALLGWSLKRCLRSRSPRPRFHGHPHEGCSRSLLHGKFRTFFRWLEPHGVKATLREWDRKINSMSEGQQFFRGPFLPRFLGNPEVRSDQNKKTWPLAVLWPRIPRFVAASYLTGLSK